MGWKNNQFEHARIWESASGKVIGALNEKDLDIAKRIFGDEYGWMSERAPTKEAADLAFRTWVIACFSKENVPLVLWFMDRHGDRLTEEEEEVLIAAHETRFDAFRVINHSEKMLILEDTGGDRFLVETCNMPAVAPGVIVLGRLMSKGPGSWFAPGGMFAMSNDELYSCLVSHRRFRDSWNSYLDGFFDHLQKKEKMGADAADRHTENVALLTMFLEDEIETDSFVKVSGEMLERDFVKFAREDVTPKPDMKKVRDSLFRFFSYLRDERGEANAGVLEWLGAKED
ncbi:MAG: hypothetical protein AB1468_03050 [Candidatus Micrarchaeota archaeon]